MRQTKERGSTWLICDNCGVTFIHSNAHIRNNTHSCSRKCAHIIKKKKIKCYISNTCKHCGVNFSRRKGAGGTYEYCSIKCSTKATTPKKENHPNWNNGSSERSYESREVIEYKIKITGRCEHCGNTSNLQGHHIKSWSEFPEFRNDLHNIKVLCKWCHAIEHPNLTKFILAGLSSK